MYLELIENDNYKPLPGGIFNKGFVKAYAKYVGIDEQEALQDYGQLMSQAEEPTEDQQLRYRPEVLTDDAHTASSIVPTIIFAGIILALMTGGILFLVAYIKNQPDTPPVANTSTSTDPLANTAVPQATPPVPESDDIRVEFRALSEKVSVTSTVDGNLAYDEVTPDLPKTYTAKEGLKLRYYRGFADKIQISLNGKQIVPPPPPPRGNVEVDINKENFARIFESGHVVPPAVAPAPTEQSRTTTPPPATTSTPAPSTPVTSSSTPRVTESTPRPAFTPLPTPRRSPTPIVVGRSPAPRPSPN
jgi:cytoskeletal protein RodZ